MDGSHTLYTSNPHKHTALEWGLLWVGRAFASGEPVFPPESEWREVEEAQGSTPGQVAPERAFTGGRTCQLS